MRRPLTITAAIMALAVAGEASAHARLVTSNPRPGQTVAAPKALTLTFSSRIDLAKSSVVVTGPHGAVATGPLKLEPKVRHVVTVPTPALTPGDYKVKWTMTTDDTHTMDGDFRFKVK